MSGRDVIGIAQTGTGKTAAFALPILHQLAANPRPLVRKSCRVLVLSPTRELSGQILDSFRTYGRHLRLKSALAIGGVSMGGQVRSLLNGVDILVATPGRLLDLVQSNALRLSDVAFFVLDEADRMLDMGFIHDIRKIVAKLPRERQTLMFSATMPRAIADLAAQMLRDPVKVAVTPVATTVERVEQRVIRVDRAAKLATLVDVLRQRDDRSRADLHPHQARRRQGGAQPGPGPASRPKRSTATNRRTSASACSRRSARATVRTLVATDIAARGIDVDGISHVVNYDLPNVPETYVHRIGRTARAGAEGIAISLCDGEEMAYLRDIEKLIRMSLPVTDRRSDQRRSARRAAHGAVNAPRRVSRPAPRTGIGIAAIGPSEKQPSNKTISKTIVPQHRARTPAASMPSLSCSAMLRRSATAISARNAGPDNRKGRNVPKEELLEFEGLVTELLPDARFRITLDNGHQLVAYTAGRMKKNRIKTLAGDRVIVEVSPYDLEKGRLIYRHKDERAGSGAASAAAGNQQFRRR